MNLTLQQCLGLYLEPRIVPYTRYPDATLTIARCNADQRRCHTSPYGKRLRGIQRCVAATICLVHHRLSQKAAHDPPWRLQGEQTERHRCVQRLTLNGSRDPPPDPRPCAGSKISHQSMCGLLCMVSSLASEPRCE